MVWFGIRRFKPDGNFVDELSNLISELMHDDKPLLAIKSLLFYPRDESDKFSLLQRFKVELSSNKGLNFYGFLQRSQLSLEIGSIIMDLSSLSKEITYEENKETDDWFNSEYDYLPFKEIDEDLNSQELPF